jgi:hypothetical protein
LQRPASIYLLQILALPEFKTKSLNTLIPQTHKTIEPGADISVLVVSCDAYQDLWKPFFSCFFKFWPDCPFPVYLGANFKKYEDDRVQTILIGQDLDYSTNLLMMLKQIK